MAANPQLRPRLVEQAEPEIEFTDYARLAPGVYAGYCRQARPYRDPAFRRWVCLLRFDALSTSGDFLACVPLWLSLGTDEKPRASRRGKYLAEWVKANGGPPVRGDRLSPRVFIRRMAKVKVGDNRSPIPYSVVTEILEWQTGGKPSQAVNQSPSQGRHV